MACMKVHSCAYTQLETGLSTEGWLARGRRLDNQVGKCEDIEVTLSTSKSVMSVVSNLSNQLIHNILQHTIRHVT